MVGVLAESRVPYWHSQCFPQKAELFTQKLFVYGHGIRESTKDAVAAAESSPSFDLKVRSMSPDSGGSSLCGMELLADCVERCRDIGHVLLISCQVPPQASSLLRHPEVQGAQESIEASQSPRAQNGEESEGEMRVIISEGWGNFHSWNIRD